MKLWSCASLLSLLLAPALLGCAAPRPTEFINITYTPSVATGHYATWAFDLEACRDSGDARVDDERVRAELLRSSAAWFREHGFERHAGRAGAAPPDFLVSYAVRVGGDGEAHDGEWLRAKLLLRDTATGRYVWRGERKVLVVQAAARGDLGTTVDVFVEQVLEHLDVLRDPEL